MTTLVDEAVVFKGLVIQRDCHPRQEIEMIRSFYAGASSMMKIVFEIADEEDEQLRMQLTEGILAELDEFAAKVGRDEA